jgi:glycosyltransferase involved in cell wall biosynthesis
MVTIAAIVAPPANATGAASDADAAALAGLQGPGVAVVPVAVGGRAYWQERRRIVAVARQCGAQLAHTHGYRPDVVDAGALRGAGIPVVTTLHGFTSVGWRKLVYERLQLRAFRRFDAVVAVSEPVVQKLVASRVPAARVHLIPNAYSRTTALMARDAARAKLGLPPDAWVIGWVGRLSREKGLDVLLDAVATMRDRPIVIAAIGSGPERSRLEAQVKERGLSPVVRWLGLVSDAAALFPAFDVFALSSRTEGTPMALFEAMDAGVPVVVTAVGGVPAVVSAAEALLVPSEQPGALADALSAVRGDPVAAARRAVAARQRLLDVYALEPWLARYDAVYGALVRPQMTSGDLASGTAPNPRSHERAAT